MLSRFGFFKNNPANPEKFAAQVMQNFKPVENELIEFFSRWKFADGRKRQPLIERVAVFDKETGENKNLEVGKRRALTYLKDYKDMIEQLRRENISADKLRWLSSIDSTLLLYWLEENRFRLLYLKGSPQDSDEMAYFRDNVSLKDQVRLSKKRMKLYIKRFVKEMDAVLERMKRVKSEEFEPSWVTVFYEQMRTGMSETAWKREVANRLEVNARQSSEHRSGMSGRYLLPKAYYHFSEVVHFVVFEKYYASSKLKSRLRKFSMMDIQSTHEIDVYMESIDNHLSDGLASLYELDEFEHYWAFQEQAFHFTLRNHNPARLLLIYQELEEWREAKIEARGYHRLHSELTWGHTLVTMEDRNFIWEALETSRCDAEQDAANHCGNSQQVNDDGGTLISLRRFNPGPKRPKGFTVYDFFEEIDDLEDGDVDRIMLDNEDTWEVFSTAVLIYTDQNQQEAKRYGVRKALLAESKMRGNHKVPEKFHPHYLELLTTKDQNGHDIVAMIVGGGYDPESNFHLSDLSEKEYNTLLSVRPELESISKAAEIYGIEWVFGALLNDELSRYKVDDDGKVQLFEGDFRQFLGWISDNINDNFMWEVNGEGYFETRRRSSSDIHDRESILDVIMNYIDDPVYDYNYEYPTANDLISDSTNLDWIYEVFKVLVSKAKKIPSDISEAAKEYDIDLDNLPDARPDEFEEFMDDGDTSELLDDFQRVASELAEQARHQEIYEETQKFFINKIEDDFRFDIEIFKKKIESPSGDKTYEVEQIRVKASIKSILELVDDRDFEEIFDENRQMNFQEFCLAPDPNSSQMKFEDWYRAAWDNAYGTWDEDIDEAVDMFMNYHDTKFEF